MNEKERYRRAYDALPDDYEINMNRILEGKPKRRISKLTAAAAAVLLAFTTVYASSEEIREKFRMWITGRNVEAEIISLDDNTYEVIITMPDGEQIHTTAVSDEPKDPDFWIEHYRNMYEVKENSKGRVILYHQGQCIDITDKFKTFQSTVNISDHESAALTEYCYYQMGDDHLTIAHLINEESGNSLYSVAAAPEYSRTVYECLLPSYETYAGKSSYYVDPHMDLREADTGRFILYYHDQVIDLSSRMQTAEPDLYTPYDGMDKPFCHIAEYRYCYLKVDDCYISVAHETLDEASERPRTGLSILSDENQYVPLYAWDSSEQPVLIAEPPAQ